MRSIVRNINISNFSSLHRSSGTLASNGSKFDASRDRGRPFSFTIGVGQVIKGWDVGVATMSKGEKAVLHITSDFGYGARGAGGMSIIPCIIQLIVAFLAIRTRIASLIRYIPIPSLRRHSGVIPPNADLDFEGKYNEIIPARPQRAIRTCIFSDQNHLAHSLIGISFRTALSVSAQQSSSSRSTKHDCTDIYVRRRMSIHRCIGDCIKECIAS